MADHMTDEEILKIQWMFQYNPREVYDLEDVVKTRLTDSWRMYWHRDKARTGQRIYFMRSGANVAAITFIGRIASPIFEDETQDNKFLRYWVDVTYDEQLDQPITREAMRHDRDDALNTYRPFVKGHFATNFLLPPDVAARTAELVKDHTHPIGPSAGAWNRRVFVSHSHEDDEFGQQLVSDLRHALGGHYGGEDLVWYDSSGGLNPSDDWWEKIIQQLEARPVFVVILSPSSAQSKWVKDEMNMAWRLKNSKQGKRIIPVLYKPCEVRGDYLTLQNVSFAEPTPYTTAFNKLVDIIRMTDSGGP